jgi:hypothetical protein
MNDVMIDGPATSHFSTLTISGNTTFRSLSTYKNTTDLFKNSASRAPIGDCVYYGIPFKVKKPVVLQDGTSARIRVARKAHWLAFLHTADHTPQDKDSRGFISPSKGMGHLGVEAAVYRVVYKNGDSIDVPIQHRHHINLLCPVWGENCFEAVGGHKTVPVHADTRGNALGGWGFRQYQLSMTDRQFWTNWVYAWENPHPSKEIDHVECIGSFGTVVLSGISTCGKLQQHPLRWNRREKMLVKIPKGQTITDKMDSQGYTDIRMDLGQIISLQPRYKYPRNWKDSYLNQSVVPDENELLVEYTAHPDARLHIFGKPNKLTAISAKSKRLKPVKPSHHRVNLKVIDKASKKPVPVRIHIHGESGEYLTPTNRHRIPNPGWFEDYSAEHPSLSNIVSTYIDGDTNIDLPLGTIYVEVSKGYEVKPIRQKFQIKAGTKTLTIRVDKVLDWRERGWVTADTHVHFLSPTTAHLEGAAEGVNVVNLLASQWGELMTNAGDFDGKTVIGSKDAGGDGEYLVKVGTENRQHILGHISLIGYNGQMISPMCSGGPNEAALGDPVDVLLSEWAKQCHKQGGIVVMPHFPNPRGENAASIILGEIDGIEMASWAGVYPGIDPYALSDWYRYLNCGYHIPAVGGTDKMAACTPVGNIRTYAKLPKNTPFDFDNWMDTIKGGHTFVSYGPLLEFSVEGKPAGSTITIKNGGHLDIEYEVASVTVPMTQVDLVFNGETIETHKVKSGKDSGHFNIHLHDSGWLAIMVRGQNKGSKEIIAAHSSTVMIHVAEKPIFSKLDALTMLDQIEGSLAYLDTVGTRADDKRYKQMRMTLTSAHRMLHNKMHAAGVDHDHNSKHHHHEHK